MTKLQTTGRRSKYKTDFPLRAEGLARRGLNDEQIAQQLGVSVTSYYEYQQRHPEFAEAIARGKAPVDTEVENAFLKRCLGFEYNERHIETDSSGAPIRQRIIRKTVIPDTDACKYWLAKRKPREWGHLAGDPPDHPDISGKLDKVAAALDNMPFEEQQKIIMKMIEAES